MAVTPPGWEPLFQLQRSQAWQRLPFQLRHFPDGDRWRLFVCPSFIPGALYGVRPDGRTRSGEAGGYDYASIDDALEALRQREQLVSNGIQLRQDVLQARQVWREAEKAYVRSLTVARDRRAHKLYQEMMRLEYKLLRLQPELCLDESWPGLEPR